MLDMQQVSDATETEKRRRIFGIQIKREIKSFRKLGTEEKCVELKNGNVTRRPQDDCRLENKRIVFCFVFCLPFYIFD